MNCAISLKNVWTIYRKIITYNEVNVMFCPNCGAEISEDANFCFKCGEKVKHEMVKTEENTENNEERMYDLINRLCYIHTFMWDIILARFDMSKNEYVTPQGISKYSKYMAKIIECTNEDCMRTDCVTKKTIDKFAVDVDCFLQAIFERHPELIYSKYVQEALSLVTEGLSKTGHIIFADEFIKNTSVHFSIPLPKESSVYSCFQQEFFFKLLEVAVTFGEDWYQSQNLKHILRDIGGDELNRQLFGHRPKLSIYKALLFAICREVGDRLYDGDTSYFDIEKILDEFPADKAIETPRANFEKKYKHFGMNYRGLNWFDISKNYEQIFEFEMWDAENVETVYLNVMDNDFYDEENGYFYHDLLDFEIISIENQDNWSSEREGFIEILKIKATNNYPELTLPEDPILGSESKIKFGPKVTFSFYTDSPKRYSQTFEIEMTQSRE